MLQSAVQQTLKTEPKKEKIKKENVFIHFWLIVAWFVCRLSDVTR